MATLRQKGTYSWTQMAAVYEMNLIFSLQIFLSKSMNHFNCFFLHDWNWNHHSEQPKQLGCLQNEATEVKLKRSVKEGSVPIILKQGIFCS